MHALDKILPELDPLERAKKRLAMESIPLQRLKMQAEKENLPLAKRAAELRLKILEDQFNHTHNDGEFLKHKTNTFDHFRSMLPHDEVPVKSSSEEPPPMIDGNQVPIEQSSSRYADIGSQQGLADSGIPPYDLSPTEGQV